MTWIDAAALVIVILSAAFSMVRGFVREVLGVFAWVGAAFAALRFYPLVQPYVNSVLPMKNLVVYVSMGVVFLVTLIVLSIDLGADRRLRPRIRPCRGSIAAWAWCLAWCAGR